MATHHCTFAGCPNTTEKPKQDLWRWLSNWHPGIPDGYYCPDHAAKIEAAEINDTAAIEIVKQQQPDAI